MFNVFSVVIFAALGARFLLQLIANILNLRALKFELPAALDGLYKPDEYRKSQEYVRVTTKFGLVSDAFSLALTLAFWFLGGFNWLDHVVRAWGFGTLVTGLFYIGILFFAYYLVTLPFGIYGTFVIEERFGFNRTTPATFILDRIKGLLLSVLLGGSLLAAIMALFLYAGAYAWVFCWVAVGLFTLAMQYVAPTWIMPLFNKFTPMESGELKDAILKYASSVRFPLKNVFVMDGSKRSSKSNAFFAGFGRNKRIALFDTLIEQHTIPEMVSVLAHEVGHYKKKHILQGTVIGILHTGVMFFLLSLLINSPGMYRAFYMDQTSVYAGILFFGLLYTPIELALSVVMQIVSRRNECEADRFAAETTDDPQAMIDALMKLSANDLSNLTPHPFYVFLNYSHPPLLERIQAVQRVKRNS